MESARIYISHKSALFFWRTNPPWYVLEGADRNIRALRNCPSTNKQIRDFRLSEAEFGPKPIDVLVPLHSPRPRSILTYHIQKAQLPPHSLYPVRDGIHVVSPALCFVQLCNSLPIIEALKLGMELCGTYALRPDGFEDKSSRDYQMMIAAPLARKLETWSDIHGLHQARMVARYLVDRSASPMETNLYLLLCLPQKLGGYNLKRPELNPEIELPVEARLILRQEKIKPDMRWLKEKLIVEYDGEYHNDPTQALKDEKRRVVLETLGYTVIVVKKQQVYDPIAFDGVAIMIAKKCGKRIRALSIKQQVAREQLREGLLGGQRQLPMRHRRVACERQGY